MNTNPTLLPFLLPVTEHPHDSTAWHVLHDFLCEQGHTEAGEIALAMSKNGEARQYFATFLRYFPQDVPFDWQWLAKTCLETSVSLPLLLKIPPQDPLFDHQFAQKAGNIICFYPNSLDHFDHKK